VSWAALIAGLTSLSLPQIPWVIGRCIKILPRALTLSARDRGNTIATIVLTWLLLVPLVQEAQVGLPPTASFFLSNLDIWMHHDHLLGGADTTSPGTADAPEKARSPVPNLVSFMSTKSNVIIMVL